ncbi:ATP-binding cassette domain-containing protein [Labedella endophytica]|uniref:ATP-binding cassette domain-containing protein n=1 Tax=Labedella endophytica TaxID=1523160 RepID=A0A433JSU7_9MICO|nr:ATP-binding cassette domain-containing protein [Labedella endophytica]RUR01107.1 ATP-binding cassette domain-containing protein [Labedella endophytica]
MRVELDGLGHRFPGGPALFDDVSDVLHPGEVYSLTGPSGSGKSTLLAILAGWIRPTSGEVRRIGVEAIGWVFQNPFGVPGRTAVDHVALAFLARGDHPREADASARRQLERFGLAESAATPFRSLSGGEAQRLMLARGLAADPDLLLVDEPTAQLDARTALDVNEALLAASSPTTIVVVATHDSRTRDACTRHIDLGVAVPPADARRGADA